MSIALINVAVTALPDEKIATLCESFDLPLAASALKVAIHRHLKFWNKLVEVCGPEFVMTLSETLAVPAAAPRSEPAANDQNPTSAYDRDQQNRMTDAIYSLNCLSDVLCHIDQDRRGLSCLDSENLSGFLRLVIAQFPEA